MRITNDDYSPIELLSELTTRRGTTSSDTHRLFQGSRSKHSWLVDAWATRLDCVLDSFKRYGIDVGATQFVRDQGIDVLLRVQEHRGKRWRLGLQIKSELEAQRDRKKKPGQENMIGTLKRQAHEARERVDEWWVMCCFDLTKHLDLVQAVTSELTGGRQNDWIRVVDPRACAAVLNMSEAEVDAFCTLLLCREDKVLTSAREELGDYHRCVAAFVLEHFAHGLDGQAISRGEVAKFLENALQKSTVEEAFEKDLAGDEPGENMCCNDEESVDDPEGDIEGEDASDNLDLHEVLGELEGTGFISAGIYDENYRIVPTAFPGLCALFFEARVRHELSCDAAIDYMRWLTFKDLR